jgi:hypothetical protein
MAPYEWIPVVAILGFFVAMVMIVNTISQSKQRRAELQTELQAKLIERFGSTPDLVNFLQSPAGKDFVSGVQRAPLMQTRERILGGMRKGMLLGALGLGFLAIWLADDNRAFIYPGFVLLGLGVGYWGATWISVRLSRTLGLEVPSDAVRPAGTEGSQN